jgi:hypothetical protein
MGRHEARGQKSEAQASGTAEGVVVQARLGVRGDGVEPHPSALSRDGQEASTISVARAQGREQGIEAPHSA